MLTTAGPSARAEAFRSLVEAVPEAVALSSSTADDPAVQLEYVNEAFTRLSGYAPEEVVGGSPGPLVGPQTDLGALRRIEAALRAGESITEELTLHRKGGEPLQVEATFRRWSDDNGVTWYVTTYVDVTDRVAARAALWRSEEWAQAIVRGIFDVVALIDREARITWVSPSVLPRLGRSPEEVIGVSCFDLVHPDDRLAAMEEFAFVLAEGQRELPTIYRISHADGSWRSMNVSANALFDHPAVEAMVIACSDVTARVEAEERLRRSERWAQTLVSGGSDAVVVFSPDGRVSYASPAVERILGLAPDDLLGSSHEELIHPDDLSSASGLIAAGKGPFELRVRHADRGWRHLEVMVDDLLDDPIVSGLVANLRDVTERLRAEELLAEQADLLEAIARGAPLEITLQKITQMIERTVDGARCAIGMLDSDGAIRVRAAPSLSRQVVNLLDELSPRSEPAVELRASEGEFTVYDLETDGRFAAVGLFADQGLRTCWMAPLFAPGSGELIGALTVFDQHRRKPEGGELDLLGRAMNLAAIAIERRRFESTLEYQALYDDLTGLPNRALLQSRIGDALDRAGRLGSGVAVLFFDLDRFKVINDSVGHALGDQLLQAVAERLREPLRPGDTLGRFGGDEFMVVCNRMADEDAARASAERFAAGLREPFQLDGGEIFVTASIGIAFTDDPSLDAEALVRNADVAMYRAKDQGRDQHVVFTETLDRRKVEQLALEQALRTAIEEEQFELFFQPVVELADGRMTHAEALVRWHRPDHGLVMPGLFIPLAEETGLIVPLGWWVLEQACLLAMDWPQLPGDADVEIAVNLSARQLGSPDLLDVVSAVLARSGLAPHRLCFEITESDLVHDVERAKVSLTRLKDLGVQIAIDDFGTGYASLDYIRHFDMADYLKIDRSFVDGVEKEGSQEAAIVSAAIALAKSLGLRVVAEGVETLFQMEALQALECDLAQGYLFSRPVPAESAMELMVKAGT